MNKLMGQRIHDQRREKDLTMEELGKLLGVTKSTISNWEHGNNDGIKRSLIALMAELFKVSPVWLMGLDQASNVEIEYRADGHEPVKAVVDHQPIIGKSAEMAQRADLYKAALAVKPENIAVAIELLKSLS